MSAEQTRRAERESLPRKTGHNIRMNRKLFAHGKKVEEASQAKKRKSINLTPVPLSQFPTRIDVCSFRLANL